MPDGTGTYKEIVKNSRMEMTLGTVESPDDGGTMGGGGQRRLCLQQIGAKVGLSPNGIRLEGIEPDNLTTSEVGRREIDWSAYSASYDAVTWANPAYRALVERVADTLAELPLARNAKVADLGAGTGTFTRCAAERFPEGSVLAPDKTEAFLARAREKLGGHAAVVTKAFDMDSGPLPNPPFDLVLSVHALCHSADPEGVLRRIFEALNRAVTWSLPTSGAPLAWATGPGSSWLIWPGTTGIGAGVPWDFFRRSPCSLAIASRQERIETSQLARLPAKCLVIQARSPHFFGSSPIANARSCFCCSMA